MYTIVVKYEIIIFYIRQCFSNWAPQWGVRVSEKWKFVMTEEYFGRNKFICTN